MNILVTIPLFLLALFLLFWQISNFVSVFSGSPYVSAKKELVKAVLKESRLKKGDCFFELGCGSGQVLVEAGRLGAKATGYEISPLFFLWAIFRTFKSKNIEVKNKNIFAADLSRADVVYCYLLPPLLKRLAPKFKQELKKSAQIISVGFPIDDFHLIKKISIKNRTVFLYGR